MRKVFCPLANLDIFIYKVRKATSQFNKNMRSRGIDCGTKNCFVTSTFSTVGRWEIFRKVGNTLKARDKKQVDVILTIVQTLIVNKK